MEHLIQAENGFESVMNIDFWWSILNGHNASGLGLKVGISTNW